MTSLISLYNFKLLHQAPPGEDELKTASIVIPICLVMLIVSCASTPEKPAESMGAATLAEAYDKANMADRLAAWKTLSYQDITFEIMRLFVDLPDEDLRHLIDRIKNLDYESSWEAMGTLAEVELPERFVGRSLKDLDIRNRYKVSVIGNRLGGIACCCMIVLDVR